MEQYQYVPQYTQQQYNSPTQEYYDLISPNETLQYNVPSSHSIPVQLPLASSIHTYNDNNHATTHTPHTNTQHTHNVAPHASYNDSIVVGVSGGGNEADILFIKKIDREIIKLNKSNLYVPCIELHESVLPLRRKIFGDNDAHTISSLNDLCELYNRLSQCSMNVDQLHQSIAYLQRAHHLTTYTHKLTQQRIQTLNNLACCYKRLNRCSTALELLREALCIILIDTTHLQYNDDMHYNESRATTHLNMCALLSQLGQHSQAIEHARASVLYCQKSLLPQSIDSHTTQQRVLERIATLAIAYHNLAVELEYTRDYGGALIWYEKALSLAHQHMCDNTSLIDNFTSSLQQAQQLSLQNKQSISTLSTTQQRNLLATYKHRD